MVLLPEQAAAAGVGNSVRWGGGEPSPAHRGQHTATPALARPSVGGSDTAALTPLHPHPPTSFVKDGRGRLLGGHEEVRAVTRLQRLSTDWSRLGYKRTCGEWLYGKGGSDRRLGRANLNRGNAVAPGVGRDEKKRFGGEVREGSRFPRGTRTRRVSRSPTRGHRGCSGGSEPSLHQETSSPR